MCYEIGQLRVLLTLVRLLEVVVTGKFKGLEVRPKKLTVLLGQGAKQFVGGGEGEGKL